MTPEEFDVRLGEILGAAQANNACIYAVTARSTMKSGQELREIPVGMAVLSLFQTMYYPHVFWMPWATDRNKIESAVRFLADLNKEGPVVILSPQERVHYYSHLGRYGLLRKVGLMRNYYGKGEDATLFEGVR